MKPIRIRPGYIPYTLAIAVLLTAGSALLKAGHPALSVLTWCLILPLAVAAALDVIEFDGRVIRHCGPLAWILKIIFRVPRELKVTDIEAVTTETTSLSFATGDAKLSYNTRIAGAGVEIVLRSHRATYLPFVRALFDAVGADKLDPRSAEIVEYLDSGKALRGSPVLKTDIAAMPMPRLRRIANALRLTGRLAQASSYFRVAYEKEPRNPQLLYEMSRFFHSSAQNEDSKLRQRSDACLRLASRLASDEPALLERIGEAFFERLDYKRAADCFRRALDTEPNRFRANIGLAEIALRDGKLAHVAHYYNAAAATDDAALRRMAGREARYYERLMGDDDFLEGELRRIRVSNQIRWARRLAALAFFTAWMMAGVMGRFYSAFEDFGWAVMASSGFLWCIAAAGLRLFRRRAS